MPSAESIVRQIEQNKLIAILRGVPGEQLAPIADALYEGGVRLIECTFDHSRDDCVAANAEMIAALRRHLGERMAVGAGTVLTIEEVRAAVDAGGQMVISPNVNREVIAEALKLGAVSIPGALTPTEVAFAWEQGAHFVKIFPAGSMGPEYIKAIRAPLSHIKMLAVGGIEPEVIPAYVKAGISGFGVGGPLLPKDEIARGNYQAVTERARAFVSAL